MLCLLQILLNWIKKTNQYKAYLLNTLCKKELGNFWRFRISENSSDDVWLNRRTLLDVRKYPCIVSDDPKFKLLIPDIRNEPEASEDDAGRRRKIRSTGGRGGRSEYLSLYRYRPPIEACDSLK